LKKNLKILQDNLGIFFNDQKLLELALVHSSFINENPEIHEISNERLEFLGDALIGMYLAEYGYKNLSNYDQGDLTLFRSALARRKTLAMIAKSFNLGLFLFIGKGEEKSLGREKESNLSDVFEAIVGAIYIDQGFIVTFEFLNKTFSDKINNIINLREFKDSKSILQELVQQKGYLSPVYEVIEIIEKGKDKIFVVEVRIGHKKNHLKSYGVGQANKISLAEFEAAIKAINFFNTKINTF
tara:strand:- start:2311 stop:3033 length:723 start_codon:yes stop_codon:yes gene_type:complete